MTAISFSKTLIFHKNLTLAQFTPSSQQKGHTASVLLPYVVRAYGFKAMRLFLKLLYFSVITLTSL